MKGTSYVSDRGNALPIFDKMQGNTQKENKKPKNGALITILKALPKTRLDCKL